MARRPAFLNAQLLEGEFGQYNKEEDKWYICRYTSVREPGKKNPGKIAVKVAVSSPSGRMDIQNNPLPTAKIGNFRIFEFGYSYSMKLLCPVQWKKSLGADWEMIFLDLIKRNSPSSYLLEDKNIQLPEGRSHRCQQRKLIDMIPPESLNQMDKLKTLYMVSCSGRKTIASLEETHIKALSALDLSLDGSVYI